MTPPILGIVWYKESEYGRCKALFTDAHTLPDSWREWKTQAETIHAELVQQGCVVIWAYINPDTFLAWCTSQGLSPDHNGLSFFASAKACRAMTACKPTDQATVLNRLFLSSNSNSYWHSSIQNGEQQLASKDLSRDRTKSVSDAAGRIKFDQPHLIGRKTSPRIKKRP